MQYQRLLKYQLPLIRGDDVRAVQQALIVLNIAPPCGTADGIYGPATADAVTAFQKSCNLTRGVSPKLGEDGVVGDETWGALFNGAVQRQPRSPLILNAARPVTPISESQCKRVRSWLEQDFGTKIQTAVAAAKSDRRIVTSPEFDEDTVYAIACQEAACYWLAWTDSHAGDTDGILARCVFDASGDVAGSPRSAFPKNTQEFRESYPDLADILVDEANKMRAWRTPRLGPAQIVYKGYGIFQYDLQNVKTDPDFFRQKRWYDFDACLEKLIDELADKSTAARGAGDNSLRGAVRRYNGGGPRAEAYADKVMQMREWV